MKAIDLFAGAGGFSRAALKDVAELLATVPMDEYEPWPAGMYASVAAVQETLDRAPA